MRVYDVLDLTSPDAVVGKHSVWLPHLNIKVPFQWGGRVQKYQHSLEADYPLETLAEEYAFLQWLAARQWAPPIGEWVYFKTVISEHPGGWWADPCGAYGWEMGDAYKLPPGTFTPETAQALRGITALFHGSDGAWNDLLHPDRGNVANGYVIDVRRTWWDRIQFHGPVPLLPQYHESTAQLLLDLHRDGQFPFGEREHPYQEVHLAGEWLKGEREVVNRAGILTFAPEAYDSVLDVGTCTGGFLQYAYLRGARPCVGLDVQPEYVDLARRLARANGMNLCFREWNTEQHLAETVHWLRQLMPRGVDHLLLLSMYKHFARTTDTLWQIVDTVCPRATYLETNAVKQPPYPLADAVAQRKGTHLGFTQDRNLRAVYRVG